MRYKVTVTQSQVYHVEAYSEPQACRVGLDAARMEMPPDYKLDAQADAEMETEESCQRQ